MANRREREQRAKRQSNARQWAKESTTAEATCVKLPDGVEWFKLTPSPRPVEFDIMEFLAGKGNPRADEGNPHFERSYDAHRLPTPAGSRLYACRKANFGQPCPVCEWLIENGGRADPELVKQIRGSTGEFCRHLWLVNDKPGSTKPAWKVLDTNHRNRGQGFGEQIVDAINSLPDEIEDPFSLTGGHSCRVTVKEGTFPGGKYNYASRIDLIPRRYDYPESLLDEAPCLDEMLVDVGYDTMKDLLEGRVSAAAANGDAHPPERPAPDKGKGKGKGKEPEEGDEEGDFAVGELVEHDDYGECEVKAVGRDGLLILEDEDGKTHRGVDPDECRTPEEEEEPEKPAKGKAAAKESTADDYDLSVGDVVKHDEYGRCEITKISPDGTSLTLEDEDGDSHRGVGPDEVSPCGEDEEEDETPKKPASKTQTRGKPGESKPSDEDEEEDDDTDDDEEEEPRRKPAPKGGTRRK